MKIPSGLRYNDLMTAVLHRDAESVHQLLKLGKWVDKPDSRGVTPLMVAAELGDLRTAETLLRGGANASRALPVAEERRHGEMLRLLSRYSKR
jgi:ankyrin repeat protein